MKHLFFMGMIYTLSGVYHWYILITILLITIIILTRVFFKHLKMKKHTFETSNESDTPTRTIATIEAETQTKEEIVSPPSPISYKIEEDDNEEVVNEEILKDTPQPIYYKQRHCSFLDECISLIKDNTGNEHYNAKTLANDLNMERSVLYKKLKRYTNLTPAQLIEKTRVEYAIVILKESDMADDIVAAECGFKTTSAMMTSFKKHHYQEPDYYRKNNKSNAC